MEPGSSSYRLLQGISNEDQSAFLSLGTEKQYQEGEVVVEEGKDQDGLFLIEEGGVEILRTGEEPGGAEGEGAPESLTRFGRGNFFGELAVFDPAPASASVRTNRASRILYLPRERVLGFLEERPEAAVKIYRNLLSELATRLRKLDQKLVERIVWVQEDGEQGAENEGGEL